MVSLVQARFSGPGRRLAGAVILAVVLTRMGKAAETGKPSFADAPFVLVTAGPVEGQTVSALPGTPASVGRFCTAPGSGRGVRLALYEVRPATYGEGDQLFTRLGGFDGPASGATWVVMEQWQAAPGLIKSLVAAKEAGMKRQAEAVKGFAGGWLGMQGRQQDSIVITRYFADEAAAKAATSPGLLKWEDEAMAALSAGVRQLSEMTSLGPCALAPPQPASAPEAGSSKKKKKK